MQMLTCIKHVSILLIYIVYIMRLLLAFMLLLACSRSTSISKSNYRFIVFAHDGTFYKLDPQLKEVEWHNQLPFKLLSLDIAPAVEPDNDTNTRKIFIPTIDGDFLYLEHSMYRTHSKQILVPREDVQHLLDICFDSSPGEKYFVYQKLEYFVLDTMTGQYRNLEDYLSQKLIFNKSVHSIIIVGKKLLKQLNTNMEVKWSVISSKISLVDVDKFVHDTKLNQPHTLHEKYSFVRVDSKTIEIYDENRERIFEIESSSSIMNIFSQDLGTHVYSKMLIKNQEHKMLALEAVKGENVKNQRYQQIANAIKEPQKEIQSFPQSISVGDKKQFKSTADMSHLQICIRTQKILKQANQLTQSRLITPKSKQALNLNLNSNPNFQKFDPFLSPQLYTLNPQELPTLPYSSDKHIRVIITKQQPFVYIFLIAIIIGGGLLFYRFKVNKLWEQISQRENVTDEQMRKIVAKLGEYQNAGKELKKMYEVNWEKMIYRNGEYFVFQGRFLNQNVEVFMVPFAGHDIIDIQHKLNILLNCSHKHMTKLYYYSLNDDSLLIFSQVANEYKKLTQLDAQLAERLLKQQEQHKSNIRILMDSAYQLMNSKIELNCFSEESVMVSERLEIKINAIPTILMKVNEEQDKKFKDMGTSRLRVDLIRIIHRMVHKGEQFDLLKFEKEKNSETEQNSFLKDFYDHFLLTEQNPIDMEALKSSEKHPFLWDAKHKMLYVCDFSNYVETCIDQQKISKMELHCRNLQIIPLPWNTILHPTLAKQLNSYRKYDFNSTRDLIRLIRNKLSHFHEIPKETRVFVGKTPEQFVQYFLEKFPKLLSFMYAYAAKKKWKLSAAN